MNKFPSRYMNGQTQRIVDDRFAKAYDGLEALLIQIAHANPTGEAYLRLKLNQGGIQGVKISIESDPLAGK